MAVVTAALPKEEYVVTSLTTAQQKQPNLLANFPRCSPKAVKISVLVIALCATIGLFSLPVVFHYLSTDDSMIAIQQSTFANGNSSMPCSSHKMTWSKLTMNLHVCNMYQYTGTICGNVLSKWHQCAVGSGDITINNSIISQHLLEDEIKELNDLLDSFTDCQEAAIPFLCQYYFPLKDCTTDNIYTASKEDCVRVSTTVCATPWNIAVNFGHGHQLPKCDTLPYAHTEFFNDTTINITDTWEDFNITCREDFYELNNTCLPRCDKFEGNPHTASLTMVVSEEVAVSIGVLACLIIIILSIKDYKTMCSFPSIFLLFIMVDYLAGAIFVIIAAIDRTGLLCRSKSLEESLRNPTLFCALSGAVFHYVIVNMTLWWFFHLCISLYKVMFPFHAKRAQNTRKQKYLFAVLVLFGFVIPLPAVIISLSTEKHKYRLTRFPPTVCNTDGDMWFYSTTLLITILLGAGVCFLIIIYFVIHTHHSKKQNKLMLSTAEKKIILVFISFLIFGVYTMVHVAIVTAYSDKVIEGLLTYFKCELSGHVPDKCDRSVFERYSRPYMSAVSYLLLGLIPLSILNYVFNIKQAKESLRRCYMSLQKKPRYETDTSKVTSNKNGGETSINVESLSHTVV